jgi:putative endonuclease
MYYVYILQNPKGLLYKGQTNDLCKRVNQHNDTADGFSSYTKGRGPWRLVYFEEFEMRSAAKEREEFFKQVLVEIFFL